MFTKRRIFLGIILLALVISVLYLSGKLVESFTHTIDIIEMKELKFIEEDTYFTFGDFNNAEILKFIRQENIFNIFQGSETEFKRILRVKNWIRKNLKVSLTSYNYNPWQAWTIMESVRGRRSHIACVEYSVVFSQILMGLGIPTRYIILDSARIGKHYVVEVWSREFNKWIMIDLRLDKYYQRDGVPLSVLELHQALIRRDWDNIDLVKDNQKHIKATEEDLREFKDFELILRNDHITRPLTFYEVILNIDHKLHVVTKWDDKTIVYKNNKDKKYFDWIPNICIIKITNKDLRKRILNLEFNTLVKSNDKYLVYGNSSYEFSSREYKWYLQKGYNRLTVFPANDIWDAQTYIAVEVK